jgi:hypothetical protein
MVQVAILCGVAEVHPLSGACETTMAWQEAALCDMHVK